MKNPKVGDRVRVYQGMGTYIGAIIDIFEDGGDIYAEVNERGNYLHPKQLRRLKPKIVPPEIIWLKFFPQGISPYCWVESRFDEMKKQDDHSIKILKYKLVEVIAVEDK